MLAYEMAFFVKFKRKVCSFSCNMESPQMQAVQCLAPVDVLKVDAVFGEEVGIQCSVPTFIVILVKAGDTAPWNSYAPVEVYGFGQMPVFHHG